MVETATDAPEHPRPAFGPALLLATLTAGAGVLHLVMAPIHAGGSGVEAAGFALAGWLQLTLAAFLLVRPARAVLATTAGVNAVFVAVWALSRTVGLPVGEDAGTAERVGAADLTTVLLQVGAVALAVLLLARPALLAGLSREALAVGAVIPIGALLVVTMVVISPSTAQHDHGTEAAAPEATPISAATKRCDRGFNPRSYWSEALKAGVDTGEPEAAAPMPAMAGMDHGDGHGHGTADAAAPPTTVRTDPLGGRGSKKLDAVVSRLGSDSEADAAAVVMALADFDDQEYDAFLYQLSKHSAGGHAAAHSASGDDTGGHGGHMGPTAWVPLTDQAQCDKLAEEIELARDTALKYPTAADAEAAGWRKVTSYVPGIAAHYMNFANVDGTFQIDQPEMILYDGNGPDARVVGLSYYVMQRGDAEPTQGFTGDNDHYHRHIGLCMKGGLVVGPSTMSPEECAAAGGVKGGGNAGWMGHAWVVPGCESPWGIFSGASPLLDRQLAEESGKNEGGCVGSKARKRYDLAPGESPAPAADAGATENAAGR